MSKQQIEIDKIMNEIINKCWDLKELVCRSQRLSIEQQEVIKNVLLKYIK